MPSCSHCQLSFQPPEQVSLQERQEGLGGKCRGETGWGGRCNMGRKAARGGRSGGNGVCWILVPACKVLCGHRGVHLDTI